MLEHVHVLFLQSKGLIVPDHQWSILIQSMVNLVGLTVKILHTTKTQQGGGNLKSLTTLATATTASMHKSEITETEDAQIERCPQ